MRFVPKRQEIPMIPIWETGQEGGRSRPINRDLLFSVTKEVVNVFKTLDIKYCLSHGTALGVVRDGDTIPWDDDVDIAIFAPDRPKLQMARTELRKQDFYVPDEGDPTRPINPLSNMPYYDFVAIKDGEKVECWIFDKIGSFYVYDPKREGLALPEEHFNTFDTIIWRDTVFSIPHNVEGYLTRMYGTDWKVPQQGRKYNSLRAP